MLIVKFGGGKNDIGEKIEQYEALIGQALPRQLRTFLEKYNGGCTPKTRLAHNGVSLDVKAFFGMGNVRYSYDEIRPIGYNGESYLPIAVDSFGNEYVIALNAGNVAFRDHESSQIEKFADDFREFAAFCESDRVTSSYVKSVEEREQELKQKGRGAVVTEALRDMWRVEIAKHSSAEQEEVDFL